jgi:D-alanyl-D-alanine carboxypeptidase
MAALRHGNRACVMQRIAPSPIATGAPWRCRLIAALCAIITACCVLAAGPARAQIGSDRYSAMVMEAATGSVLIAANPDEPRHPASLTKMMTLYMVFEALRDRRLSLDQTVPVSAHAASMSPSKLGLTPATRITVEQAIMGLVTKSANDAASAIGELLGGGDEDRFGQMMTLRARALGMSHTVFRNASGLPDPDQITTARDLAVLARHLVQDFPSEYRYFSIPVFRFHGQTILNHDHLLQTYPGADGIKTGYIEASGFNLVTSAVRGDVRLIGVVLGASHPGERDLHMAALLDQGFEQLNVPVMTARHEPGGKGLGLIAAAQAATLEPAAARTRIVPARWSVQIGSFATEQAARATAAVARRAADAGDIRVESFSFHGRTLFRAVLGGLSQSDARTACNAVPRRHLACTQVRPETGQLASR